MKKSNHFKLSWRIRKTKYVRFELMKNCRRWDRKRKHINIQCRDVEIIKCLSMQEIKRETRAWRGLYSRLFQKRRFYRKL